jgi:excinuclease ABC subunit A
MQNKKKNKQIAEENLEIFRAKEHNLKNISLTIPRNKFVVITGLSGSGKSSLAFDTIHAEGQRRYMETFSAYARRFLGEMRRPAVDKITGLSPVISIEQKTVHHNPRSTVGTITEIYDFLRLLFARVSTAYSYLTNEPMVKYTEQQLIDVILTNYKGKVVHLLAPVVRARKGHYREVFEQIRKWGFLYVRLDGEIKEVEPRMQANRYKTHDIEIVIDTIKVEKSFIKRLTNSMRTTLKYGKGNIMLLEENNPTPVLYSKFLMDPQTGISYPEPEPNMFSFNSPYGYCSHCKGLGYITEVDMEKLIPNAKKTIRNGGIEPLGVYKSSWIFKQVEAICKKYKTSIDVSIENMPEKALYTILYGTAEPIMVKNETMGVMTSINFEGIINFILSHAEESSSNIRKWATQFMHTRLCEECQGGRLKKEANYFRIGEKNIVDLANMDITVLAQWMENIEQYLTPRQQEIAKEIIRETKVRLSFLLNLGIDYLRLNRFSQTLSGGEIQRIRLATQIGSKLVNVLYILDEPSVGLHQRDNQKLIQSLKNLRDIGNSIIVVEHDYETMRAADHIIDMGPGAGVDGGSIVAEGSFEDIARSGSLTGDYLSGKKKIETPLKTRKGSGKCIEIIGASGHNLKNINVKFPLETFICVTGVSGSGKSSLVAGTLYPILNEYVYHSTNPILPYKSVKGLKHIDKVIEINQQSIGRTPRSNPVTYIGVFEEIRKLYASLPEARVRNYRPSRFSFNVTGGRCETCKGSGVKTVEMGILPEVYVPCDECNAKRYNRETLEVRYKGKSINDILEMTFTEAVQFFDGLPAIRQKMKMLQNVGLGYLHLGQISTTLSGGEAQRVKLAAELSKKDTGKTFYILDEPTTGLHFEDVRVLLNILHRLVDKGNTVLVIEHNIDVIKTADRIIDLGPEGGDAGGYLVAQGTPKQIAKVENSYTGQFLKQYLKLKTQKSNKDQGSKVKGSKVKKAKVKKAKVKGSEVKEAKVKKAKVKEAKVKEAKVKGSKVKESKVKGSKVKEAKVKKSKVKEAKVKEAKVKEAKVKESKVKESKAKESKAKESKAKESKAKESKVKGAKDKG